MFHFLVGVESDNIDMHIKKFPANFTFSFCWSQHRRPTHFSDVKITNKSIEIMTKMEFLVSRVFCTSDVGDWSISPAGTPGMKGTCEATKILFNFHFFFFPHFYFLLCDHLLCLFFSLSLLFLHSHQNYFHILYWYWDTINVIQHEFFHIYQTRFRSNLSLQLTCQHGLWRLDKCDSDCWTCSKFVDVFED